MDYLTLGAIVVGIVVVGFLIKQIKIFLLLATLVGVGLWFFVLDENQKTSITQSVKEDKRLNDLKQDAAKTLDDVKKESQELTDKALQEGKELSEKAIEEIKEGVEAAKEKVKIPTH